MNRTRKRFSCNWIIRCILSLVVSVGLASTSFAAQFDSPFMKAQQENKANWSKEDKALDKEARRIGKKVWQEAEYHFYSHR